MAVTLNKEKEVMTNALQRAWKLDPAGKPTQRTVVTGTGFESQLASRELISVSATIQTATWNTDNQKVYAIEVTVVPEQTSTASEAILKTIGITFDAPNNTVAQNWLTVGSHKTDDAEYEVVVEGHTRRFEFEYALSRVDVIKHLGTPALRVKIKAEAA